jgi:hypothetical protein
LLKRRSAQRSACGASTGLSQERSRVSVASRVRGSRVRRNVGADGPQETPSPERDLALPNAEVSCTPESDDGLSSVAQTVPRSRAAARDNFTEMFYSAPVALGHAHTLCILVDHLPNDSSDAIILK